MSAKVLSTPLNNNLRNKKFFIENSSKHLSAQICHCTSFLWTLYSRIKDRILDSVLIWVYTSKRKPVFWHILRSVYFLWMDEIHQLQLNFNVKSIKDIWFQRTLHILSILLYTALTSILLAIKYEHLITWCFKNG